MFKAYSGTGTVFMRPVDSAGQPTGDFKPVGDAYPLSCQVTTEQLKKKSRRVETAGQIIAAKNEITDTTGSLTLHEWNAANLAYGLSGTAVALTDTSGSASAEAVTAPAAGEYKALAHRDVSNVVITGSVEGTDFNVDATLGLLTIIDGGNLSADDSLSVDYDYAAKSGYQVDIGSNAQIRVQVLAHLYSEFADKHFVMELDSVVLGTSSDINFISEEGSTGELLEFSMTLETLEGQTSPGRVDGIPM